ncbi:WD repeat-containing protein 70-like [Clavelina lepadiformis]|uniref:WD repeat-containing protein 70 n=1 Tax=Clavelina lepadiformis TaxID=159417 RepID=A0ABP0FSJ0_CLALP
MDSDSGGQSMEELMGFGGFGKKARTFDLKAIFEETRRNAQERSKKGLDEMKALSSSIPNAAEKKNIPKQDQQKSSIDGQSSDDESFIGPPMPPPEEPKSSSKDAGSSDDSDSEKEEEEDKTLIPATHEITLNHGIKPVSSLALDPSGARLVTGSYDFEMRFWDFAGMDSSLQSFRHVCPCECHHMLNVQYSATGENILVIAANSQAKVYDRDGHEILECIKGDQYLNDMFNTAGHTAALNGGCWHPKVKGEFMTSSNDGTVRTWDVRSEGKKCKTVRKCKDKSGRRTQPTACCYSRDAKYLACACNDGSLMLWAEKMKVHTSLMVRGAHTQGSHTSSITFSQDGTQLCTRGGDDTVKLWDVRKFKHPVATASDLTNFFPVTDCVFSPNEKLLMTGVSVRKGEGQGKLVFLDRNDLEVVNEMNVANSSVVRCLWHAKLNQIVLGTGDGDVKVLYDADRSFRGAKLCVVKKRKKINHAEVFVRHKIITPYSLPMYRDDRERSTKKQQEKDRKDPVKSHRPQPPLTSRGGAGGRLKAHGSTLASFIMKTIAKDKTDDTNAREAILRHAQAAETDPKWVSHAYAKTQPETIFDDGDDESSDEDSHVIIGGNKKPEEKDGSEPAWKKAKFT